VFCHLLSFSEKFIVVTGFEKEVVEVALQRNNRKMKGLIWKSQPERTIVSSQDRVNGLNDAVWRH
jgi:choline kinase